MKELRKYIPDVLVILFFIIASYAYFYPAVTENRVLYRHDASAGRGMGQEISEYKEQTGELARWTNSAFSGMPTYQTAPAYDSVKPLTTVTQIYHLGLPEYVWYLFAYLLGFYIMLRAFDIKWHLATLGSILWAFSTYFLIIIAAGHIWKVMALVYLPPMIGGIMLAYRGKYLLGFIVTALFTAMEINANHIQMTYYYMFIIFLMAIGFLVDAIKQKKVLGFAKASGVCLAAAIVGLMVNISSLYHTWEYQNESMRSKSELVKKNAANQTSSGLDRDYITAWSYGSDELLTLMIPNAMGGTHDIRIGSNEKAMEAVSPEAQEFVGQWFQYWGEQSYTAGPVYIGAFVVLLFLLGIFIAKSPIKWPLIIATILSILLSLGHNLQWFSDIFIDYMPMYSKFRTVSSILVIAEFTMPLLGILALKRLYDEPDFFNKKIGGVKNITYLYVAYALTGGVCLFFAIFPGCMGSFFSGFEQDYLIKMGADEAYIAALKPELVAARKVIFTSDCWRSFWYITIGTALMLGYIRMAKKHDSKKMAMITFLLMAAMCLVDMWQVNKRYLYDSMFVNASEREAPQPMTDTDREILKDKSLDYRVLNMASNTFNENQTSYYHKSIGGYHAAKMRRYNELISAHIEPEMQRLSKAIIEADGNMEALSDSVSPVLNMLNTKYVILPLQGGNTIPLQNPRVNGNAWFVNKINYVNNANEELAALGKVDLKHEAVADKSFKQQLGQASQQDSTAVAKITSYAPNHLEYDVDSKAGGVLVFSEIYYPHWTATVDGKNVEIGRVNYVLRAIQIDGGKHKVVLDFHPKTLQTTETAAYAGEIILLVSVILLILLSIRRHRKEKTDKSVK